MRDRIAVKGFIVNDSNEILLLKRKDDNVFMPGIWEPPGGRLEDGESIEQGLKREVLEETGLKIKIGNKLVEREFNRPDGEKIHFTSFKCSPINTQVRLSEEHSNYMWLDVGKSDEELIKVFGDDFFMKEIELIRKK